MINKRLMPLSGVSEIPRVAVDNFVRYVIVMLTV